MPIERAKTYSIDEVLPYVLLTGKHRDSKNPAAIKVYDGKKVWMTSSRYRCFLTKGLKCASCDLVGKFFALEQCFIKDQPVTAKTWHFNLYAVTENGEEVLMTQDHIVPQAKGGRGGLDNLQTMCTNCNLKKGSSL